MIDALAGLPAGELVVQHGPASPPPARRAMPFVDFGEMSALMEQASVVVCHAGVGSILCALRAGHVPVVVPRLARYGETVDDHQAELAGALHRAGRVLEVVDVGELGAAVRTAAPRRAASELDGGPLQIAVRDAVMGRRDAGRRRARRH
jgi:UDP-N-acetylglucosamine transferase subunit ALG13